MMKITLITALCLLLIACHKRKTSSIIYPDQKVLSINNTKIGCASYIKDIKYILLENTEKSMFSEINKIKFKNNNIYILDASGIYYVFVFDMNGKFLTRIGRKGKGPGEYLMLCDFDVEDNGDVILYDRQHKKLMRYNSEGEYIKELHLPFRADGFSLLNDHKYMFSLLKESTNDDINNQKVIVTDENFNILNMYFQYDEKSLDNKGNSHLFRESSKGFIYSKPVNDSLFVFNYDGDIKELYVFDYKDKTVPLDFKNDYGALAEVRQKHNWMYSYETPMLLGNNFLVSNIFNGGSKAFLLIDIQNKQTYLNELDINNFKINDLNYALTTLGDTAIVSYLEFGMYQVAKDKSNLKMDVKKHLQNGGFVLMLSSIRK